MLRPWPIWQPPSSIPASVVEVAAVTGLRASLLPLPRPKGLAKRRAAEPEASRLQVRKGSRGPHPAGAKTAVLPKKGSVCGDPEIRGAALAPITSRVKGCGVEDPVKVTQIAGVAISPAATITCETAKAAKQWIDQRRATGLRQSGGEAANRRQLCVSHPQSQEGCQGQ